MDGKQRAVQTDTWQDFVKMPKKMGLINTIEEPDGECMVWVDTDYAGCRKTRKYTSGWGNNFGRTCS